MEVDVHGMTTAEAKKKLERMIANLPAGKMEIDVIHGYRQGNELQNMVRKTLKSNRIKRKILSLNQGITTLMIE